MKKTVSHIFMRRWFLLAIFFFGLWTVLLVRAFEIQILPDSRLGELKHRQFETVLTLPARRGAILDRNGRELAVSVPSFSLYTDPFLVKEPKRASKRLSQLLRRSRQEIYTKLKLPKRRFVWLKRFLSEEEKKRIEALKIAGLGFQEELKRVYPNDHLLAQTLGFVGNEGRGLEGIEAEYDAILQGFDKRINLKRDARGRPLLVNGQIFTKRPDGADLHLTIDGDLQYELERELHMAYRDHDADSAMGVILDAQTSEVLSVASAPFFDPNEIRTSKSERRRNRAIVDAFEPGSTMKPFVIAAALEKKMIQPNSKFHGEQGFYKVGSRTIKEADAHHRFGWLSVTEILAFSSNIGATKVAEKIGDKTLREFLLLFGFGQRTGVELPAESSGILQPLPWRPHLLANVSFGHGISASPIQIASAYAAIARGGVWKRPFLVEKVESEEAHFSFETSVDQGRRVVSSEVAQNLTLMLTAATAQGASGGTARVHGYPVAGKTGTAQKVNPEGRGYLPNAYISSFAGFIPAHRPRYVIYIAVDHPKKGAYYGTQVAAPVFSRIATFAVQRAGIPPVLLTEKDVMPVTAPVVHVQEEMPLLISPEVVPPLKGLTLREVMRVLKKNQLDARIYGQGIVSETEPAEGQMLPKGRRLSLFLKAQ